MKGENTRIRPSKLHPFQLAYEVTLKLTVDSTYQQETPIQIEVTGDARIIPTSGIRLLRDIGLLAPNPSGLYTPVPGNP